MTHYPLKVTNPVKGTVEIRKMKQGCWYNCAYSEPSCTFTVGCKYLCAYVSSMDKIGLVNDNGVFIVTTSAQFVPE